MRPNPRFEGSDDEFASSLAALPKIISVDDHVLEPADIWTSRLPQRHREQGPRLLRERGAFEGGVDVRSRGATGWRPDRDGGWADVWYYEDLVKPLDRLFASVGEDKHSINYGVVTLDDVRPGCWQPDERLADMDLNHTEASLCFPNTLPRFCGQTFLESKDKAVALLCVRAYNDWIIEEWCGGSARGRLIPITMVPLWDVSLATEEVQRCAAKGAFAVTFTENPSALGLPSVYSGAWDPFFAACEAVGTTVCMHIGSSSTMAMTVPDAPQVASSTLTFQYGMHSLIDWIYSRTLDRFPALKIAYSEGNVGWMPYVLERMDKLWHEREGEGSYVESGLPRPPSAYIANVYGCIVDDEVGLETRHRVGMGQICFETDYPHVDSTFPHSAQVAAEITSRTKLTEAETFDFVRGNAIRAFGLERFGISE